MALWIVLCGLLLLLGTGYPLCMSLIWLAYHVCGHKEPYLEYMRSI